MDQPHVAKARLRGFLSNDTEVDDLRVEVQGTLPPWLTGRYLLNGPALWDLPGGSFRHWFDGLAKLHRFQIDAGGVRYQSRMLRTQALAESRAAGRPELGGFDTSDTPGLLGRLRRLRNPRRTDNGCVVMSRSEQGWIAQTESDRAMRFEASTLDTLGELHWQDPHGLPLMAAHPQVDARGGWWNVGIALGPSCQYVLFRLGAGGQREIKARIAVKRAGYLHAFALTERHAVIWEAAWRAHPLRFLFSGESYSAHFDWMPEGGSRIHAVDLSDGAVRSWDAPALFAFHAPQAFERGTDLVLDLCESSVEFVPDASVERLRAGAPLPHLAGRHRRYVLSTGASRASIEELPGRFDLPQVHPEVARKGPARYVWGSAVRDDTPGHFFNAVLQLDLQTSALRFWSRPDSVALEPLFVPRPGGAEADGVLLVHTLADADPGSVIAVLDAASLECRATLHLPFVIPFGFHGAFAAA